MEDKTKENHKEKVVGIIRKYWVITLLLLLLGGWFYWFQWRPTEIRNYCDRVAWNEMQLGGYLSKSKQERYDWKYTQCLHSQGLK